MADDKSKRGSPDNKRLNKSEPYEVAYAKKKALEKSAAAPAKKAPAAAKKSGSATTTATAAAKKSPARANPARDGSTPKPTARASREKGAEKDVGNTAPVVKRVPDAVDLLTDDHLAVNACFKKYQKLADADAPAEVRQQLATTICKLLTVHATIEEEIFYPAARAAGIEEDLMNEADIEHASAKDLIAQIEAGSPDDDHYDARVTVLGEYIEHHVVEEHAEMFSKCRRAKMELVDLRARLESRQAELMGTATAGGDDEDEGLTEVV